MGNLDKQVGRLDEARRNLEIALVIHREVGDLRSEGVRHGDLGDLSRQEGQTDEARGRFDDGERLLRSVGDPLELAKFLTLRIRFEMAMGRRDEGLALLRESEALARQAQSSPGSSLMLRLAELRQSLDDGDSAGS